MDTSFVEKKFIGFLVIWASSTLLVFAQAIGESVYQYMVLGSFLVFSGSEFADRFVITRKEVKK